MKSYIHHLNMLIMNIYVSKSYNDFDKVNNGICFNTLKKAIDHLNDGDSIFLENEMYYGKIVINNNDIKIYGKDKTIISYDVSHGTKIRDVDKVYFKDKEVYGTTGSASVTIKGNGFYASNVTFKNSYKKEINIVDGQAVAIKITGNDSKFVECKFLSMQDTLYVDEAITARFERCYIEGDIDFIFGSGNAIFDNCDIMAKTFDGHSYVTAPSTLECNEYGFLFYNCKVFTDGCNAYLMRPWYPNREYRYPKACFIGCYFDEFIITDIIKMRDYNPDNAVLIYNNCIQKDKIISNVDDVSKYLKFI